MITIDEQPPPALLRCQGCGAAYDIDAEQADEAPPVCPRCELFLVRRDQPLDHHKTERNTCLTFTFL
jgi:hypothetical protein